MTTGELIQARRKEAGMTQAELGKKLGISGAGIAQWENNLRKPKKETLLRIASALNISIPDIPDEQEERLLLRLRSGRIVHTENTAFWRDAVGMYGSPTCSECGGSAAVKTRFCPHCGARMGNFVVERVQTYRGIDMTAIEYNDISDYPPEIAALAKAAEPLREYLLQRGDPHSCVVVTQYGATLKRDEIGVPFAKAKCMSDDDFIKTLRGGNPAL